MIRAETIVGDVSGLPDHNVGPASLGWWGAIGFILVQCMGFVLTICAYYYMLTRDLSGLPNAEPPLLLWSSIVTGLAIASEIPNAWVKRRARQNDLRATQLGLLLVTGIGVSLLALRMVEFAALDVRWDSNAHGSIVWSLLVLHSTCMAAAVIGWGVMAAQAFRMEVTGRRFSAIAPGALQWHFVVWSWVVLYVVIYWTPRWQ